MGFLFFSLFQKDLELFDENYGYEMADHSQVVTSFPIFILSFTNFPKENNAEYNGNRKNE